MQFRIKPKTMTGTKLYFNVISTSENSVILHWQLRTETVEKVIDEGNWTLPKLAFGLLYQLEINQGGHVVGDSLRAAIGQILSDPGIEMELADFVPDPDPVDPNTDVPSA